MKNGQGTRSDKSGKPALLLIGWDGATPDLLERFRAAGKLPTIDRLIQRGSYRRLRSTIPPVTACAWSSFLSGKNPGKHGLFDFVTPRKGTYSFDYTNGGYRKDRNADLLTQLNNISMRVGCVNVPMTYPPPQIDGFVISGLDAPDEKSGIAHPAELFDRAQSEVGPYRIDNRHLGSMKTNEDRHETLREFKRIETRRTDITFQMIKHQPVDVVVIVYNATDQVQHHFWHLMDPDHPAHPGPDSDETREFQHAIEEIYTHCDHELSRWMERYPNADVMVMSDHGAGPTSGPRVRLNNVLADAGLLTWTRTRTGLVSSAAGRFDGFLRRTLTANQKAVLARIVPWGRSAIETLGLPSIEWHQTIAFAYEGFTLSPCIWINRKGLFPNGTIEAGADYEKACLRVIDVLTGLKDPATGSQVIPQVHRSRDVYHGDHVDLSPDLILDWWTGRTFTCTKSHPKLAGEPTVFYPPPVVVPGRDISGIHRRDGVLVAGGPDLATRDEALSPTADLMDIAPTTLALMGQSPPSDMDGRIIPDLIVGEITAGQAKDPSGPASPAGQEIEGAAYSEREREIIEQRLSGLGYIE